MTEFEEKLIDGIAHICQSIDKLSDTIIKFMAWKEAINPDLEYLSDTRVEEEIITKSNLKNDAETKGDTISTPFKPEVIIQDLEGITILKKLEKSYLVLKNGYTTIVAYSHLKSGDGIVEGFFGNLNDDIFDERRWILKTKKDGTPNLEWQPFIKEEVPPWEVED